MDPTLLLSKRLRQVSLCPSTLLLVILRGPVASLIGANREIQNALIAADRLFEIMDLEREESENKIKFKKRTYRRYPFLKMLPLDMVRV